MQAFFPFGEGPRVVVSSAELTAIPEASLGGVLERTCLLLLTNTACPSIGAQRYGELVGGIPCW